ncbi:hypothetical protein G210_2066 [Candida maltosa Xu316]|uniref:NADPH-dependent 1-acyldihydroxyacetone phosphate reductase n=1 Tax=Candida maltosa (strain Xu316) TaxID=1245528 RepID=M3JEK0_CANMX|nr:hypothetical protein G210_2066 [Candida maltosa Xu316]
MSKEQKYALVTGASSGIGYNLAIELSKKGYKVFACSPEKVLYAQKPLEEENGVISIPCDIANIEDIKRVKEQVEKHTGGNLDVLYNNAGISISGPAIEIPEDQLDFLFQVNVLGHINMTKHFAPFVINRKGTILFTSSVAARVPLSWISAYNATKAAIDAYALTLHGELAPFGVRVHSVITGGVDTAIFDPTRVSSMAGSYYDVPGIYESMESATMMSRNLHITPAQYAKQIVKDITRWRDPGFNLYHGALAYFLHWVSRFLPLWMVEMGVQIHFKQRSVLRTIAKLIKLKKYAANKKNN